MTRELLTIRNLPMLQRLEAHLKPVVIHRGAPLMLVETLNKEIVKKSL